MRPIWLAPLRRQIAEHTGPSSLGYVGDQERPYCHRKSSAGHARDGAHRAGFTTAWGDSDSTPSATYVISFASPIGPSGFSAKIRGAMYWSFKGDKDGRIRRIDRWALSADDLDELEAWLRIGIGL